MKLFFRIIAGCLGAFLLCMPSTAGPPMLADSVPDLLSFHESSMIVAGTAGTPPVMAMVANGEAKLEAMPTRAVCLVATFSPLRRPASPGTDSGTNLPTAPPGVGVPAIAA